ncbi:hypothetical protein Tco_0118004, partial [Tanacetum coccineum]
MTRFFSTGHGVKLEGSINYAKGNLGRYCCLYTSGVDSELRLNRKQQAASTTPKAVSSATKVKRAASIGVFGYGILAENVFFLIFDQSIIYGVSMAYSSKSGNGLEFFKVLRYG